MRREIIERRPGGCWHTRDPGLGPSDDTGKARRDHNGCPIFPRKPRRRVSAFLTREVAAVVALPWVRLDTAMPDHPKIIDLVDNHGDAGMAAAFVWICSLAYAGKHGTDGFLTKNALARLNGKAKHARLLVEAGLWKEEGGVGWSIPGWAEYQESNEETQKRADRARAAAAARWSKPKEAPD